MNLVIFDVDGTLVQSARIDTDCFVRSLEELFGIKNINTQWDTYKTATDWNIFEEIYEKSFSKKPTSKEINMHIELFTHLLNEYYQKDRNLFQEISGANRLLAKLRSHDIWKIAIATGGWGKSTLLKIKFAGININDIPFVSASDSRIREDILGTCINNSKKHYNADRFDRIVSVGDAMWDVKTAAGLRIGFVGVNVLNELKNRIECPVCNDYQNFDAFMKCLESATVPRLDK